ncbi:MAG: 50S ribosomal protein L9 [Parvibaculaceae bacterium]
MEVVLLERIEKLGQMGDVVQVKDGYARNFLLPRGKALRANKENLARFEAERAQLEARNLELKKEAEGVHGKLDGFSIIVIRSAGDTGQLYGSVTPRDIASSLSENGFSIDRSQVILAAPVKTLGLYDVAIKLHPEVSSTIVVNVARTEEEAEAQARGEDIHAEKDEDEELDATEFFEEEAAPEEILAEAEEGSEAAVEEEAEKLAD